MDCGAGVAAINTFVAGSSFSIAHTPTGNPRWAMDDEKVLPSKSQQSFIITTIILVDEQGTGRI